MAYADLTAEQKSILDGWTNMLRATVGEFCRAGNHIEVLTTDYVGQVLTILNLLDGSDAIPNASGLAGSASLTKDQASAIYGYLQAIVAYNAANYRQVYVLACGPGNMIG